MSGFEAAAQSTQERLSARRLDAALTLRRHVVSHPWVFRRRLVKGNMTRRRGNHSLFEGQVFFKSKLLAYCLARKSRYLVRPIG